LGFLLAAAEVEWVSLRPTALWDSPVIQRLENIIPEVLAKPDGVELMIDVR